MRAGELRDGATYQEPVDGVDEFGDEKTVSWADVVALFVGVRPVDGREVFQAQGLRLEALVTHAVTHRHPGFVPSPRGRYLLDDGRVFQIAWVADPDSRKAEVKAVCVETVLPAAS